MRIKNLIKLGKSSQKYKEKYKRYIPLFLLTIISIGFLSSIVRYSWRTYYTPVWDDQHFIYMATEFYRLLKNPSFDTPYKMVQVIPFRQPGYSLFILPFLMIFGLSKSLFWGLFANGLFYGASIFGIYFLSRNYLSMLASFLAAFIFAFYGWTLYFAHFTYSETASSALSILSILFLIKSDHFQRKKYSIQFGIFLGVGLLTRWTAIIFALGPLLYILYQISKNNLFRNKVVLLNIAISIVIAFTISFYPYLVNYRQMFEYFYSHRVDGPIWNVIAESERSIFSIFTVSFYLNSFTQLGILYFLLILVGLTLAFKKNSKLKIILLAVGIPWIFFSFFSIIKGDRYIIPIYPYLAVLSASVFDYIKNKTLKISLVIITVIFSISTFFGTVWGKGLMNKNLQGLSIPLLNNLSFKVYITTISRPPDIYKKNGEEIIDFIKEDVKKNKLKTPKIIALFYYHPLNNRIMVYNYYTQEEPLPIYNFTGLIVKNPEKEASHLVSGIINEADYVLIKSGQRTDDFFQKQNYQTLESVLYLFDNHVKLSDYYKEKAKIWIYQDSSTLKVFKKQRKISVYELRKMEAQLIQILKKKQNEKTNL